MGRQLTGFVLWVLVLVSAGCKQEGPRIGHETLNSTLWVQTSVEHRVSVVQSFELAKISLKQALHDPGWTAALEQTNDFKGLAPAVIVDVDETVLDNSPFQARLIKSTASDDWFENWQAWVHAAEAQALPGAKAFVRHLKELGVKIFYVTNRQLEQPTIENLRAVLDPDVTADDVLCRNERKEWTSDKTSRRAAIAETYRVLLLIGDDYNDFTYLGKAGPEERCQRAEAYRDHWGTKWILISNSMCGSWEQSIFYGNGHQMSPIQRYRAKMQSLSTRGSSEN